MQFLSASGKYKYRNLYEKKNPEEKCAEGKTNPFLLTYLVSRPNDFGSDELFCWKEKEPNKTTELCNQVGK